MKTFKNLFTTLLLLCATVATAHDFEVDGIYYNISSSTDKTVAVTYRGNYYDSYSNEYSGSVVIPSTVSISCWRSENKEHNSTSQNSYTIVAEAGDKLMFDWSVSSEANYDWLVITLDETEILKKSGVGSGTYEKTFDTAGTYTLVVKYTKDDSNSNNSDHAIVSNIAVNGTPVSIGVTYSVTSIASYAFDGCSGLTSVVIPNSVTSIGSSAFSGCSRLTSIEIPNSVTSIGSYAFQSCYGLTSITIPNSVTSIGEWAFAECSGLKKAIWLTNTPPSGYKNVGATYNYVANNQYSGLNNTKIYPYLSSMFEVDGVRYVPVSPAERTCDAIDCTYNDTTSVDIIIGKTVSFKGIAMNVKEIMPYTLYANKKIKSVKVENEGNVGNYAFSGCTELETATVSNEGNIGDYAFTGCTALAVANISNKGNIGDYAFENSFTTNQSTANISNKGSIGNRAFSGCTALQTANISNEGNIGNYTFSGCTALTMANISNKGNIGNNAFSGCNYLVEATLGDSVTSIGTEAFSSCSMLEDIVIPNAVTSLGSRTFSSCSSLKSAEIGAGVTSINEATFSGCSAMTSITIGDNVKTIGKNAFYACSSLAEITIPQSVTKIADYVFDNCSSLADVVIENDSTVLSLGSNGSSPLFADCPLDSVYIGRKINYSTSSNYGYSPFYRNTSLRTVVITDTETEIYDNEFYGCSNLKNVTIGNGVNKIGKWAFSGCSSLDYFAFGDNVQSIGEEAFSDCNNVTRILTSAMTPPVCGNQALDDINKWNCSLYVPSEAKSAYQQAEQWKEFFFVEDLPASIGEIFEDVKGESGNVKAIYDLQGRVVENPASGIYIIDGKKVLVK